MAKITSINENLKNPAEGLPPILERVGVAFQNGGFTDDLYSHADKAPYRVQRSRALWLRILTGAEEDDKQS